MGMNQHQNVHNLTFQHPHASNTKQKRKSCFLTLRSFAPATLSHQSFQHLYADTHTHTLSSLCLLLPLQRVREESLWSPEDPRSITHKKTSSLTPHSNTTTKHKLNSSDMPLCWFALLITAHSCGEMHHS